MSELNTANLPDPAALRSEREGATYGAAQRQLESLGREILSSHGRGYGALKWGKLLPGVKEALERTGYVVTHDSGDSREPTLPDQVTTIRW